ncbi:MAG: hypothetical protein PVH68_12660 [Armatimonadota bacterium]|jgi:hypothetical protein
MPDPDFDYRTFYTWDHSTNWDLSQPGARVSGCHEPYEKPPEAFIEDYTRLVDFMSGLGLNHLIIWGALRDSHGGAPALRRLVEYGRRNGVRVAPGVGLSCYGGVYYEGDHEFSLVHLLAEQPELAALDAEGNPMLGGGNPRRSVACPRHPKMVEWNAVAMRWLMQEVAPDAIHYETGDYGVCHCDRCQSAGSRDRRDSLEDMAEVLPPIVAEVRGHKGDCWLSYNHYTGYTRRMMEQPPAFARAIPDDVICKWGVSWMLAPELQRDRRGWDKPEPMEPNIHPPTATNMAHIHFATGWWGCSPRGTLEVSRLFDSIPLIEQVGFQGICTHGEDSSLVPASELNYHVYAALAENLNATPETIAERSVGDLYGSHDLATDVLTALKDRRVPRDLPPRIAQAAETADGQQKVRLNWLTFELHRLADRLRSR